MLLQKRQSNVPFYLFIIHELINNNLSSLPKEEGEELEETEDEEEIQDNESHSTD
jgi:hypothetical protein